MSSKLVVCLLSAGALAAFSSRAQSADSALQRMDRAAAAFRDMSANVRKSNYTAVLNDTSVESGAIFMMRSGKQVRMRTDITQPDPRSVALQGGKAEIFYPKINTVQIYDLGKNSSLVDQFLLLGWATPSKELQNDYKVTVAGTDTVNGHKATRLELIPKSRKALEQITKVELWIPEDSGHPVRQRFLQPGGDFYLVDFSGVKLNSNLPAEKLNLNLPKSVKREYPQR